jgi:hypothetical protein|tara:strand:- start:69231 stop:69665 length:435 start_codon:yes stop_codon:yes gene_type:complete
MTKGVFEIFNEIAKLKTNKAKAEALKQYNLFSIRTILQGCFHPNIKFLLPDSIPPYGEADGTQVETRLHSMAKKLDIFIENGRPVANQSKREMLFIELLESIHPKDALILCEMIQKKPPVKGITKAVVNMAFPDLLPADGPKGT